MKKKILLVLLIVSLVGGTSFWFLQEDNGETEEVLVQTVQVRTGNVSDTIFVDGTVEADRRVQIRSKVSGEVIEILVEEGNDLIAGDLIALLDKSDLEYELEKAEKELEAAGAELARTKLEAKFKEIEFPEQIERARTILKEAQKELEILEKLEEVDEEKLAMVSAAVKQAAVIYADVSGLEKIDKAEQKYRDAGRKYEQAKEDLANAEIRAPITGRVTSLGVNVGDTLGSTSQVGTITDLENLIIIANIDEFDIRHIDPLQRARIVADAYPDTRFQGEVIRIADEARRDGGVVVFATTIKVNNPRNILKPGMTVDIEIITEQREDVLLVPSMAINYSEGRPVVTVNKEGEYVQRNVRTGFTTGEFIEIMEGLDLEDEIIVFSSETHLTDLSSLETSDKLTVPTIPGISSSTGSGSGSGGGSGGGTGGGQN